jgi:hypothetical protein
MIFFFLTVSGHQVRGGSSDSDFEEIAHRLSRMPNASSVSTSIIVLAMFHVRFHKDAGQPMMGSVESWLLV